MSVTKGLRRSCAAFWLSSILLAVSAVDGLASEFTGTLLSLPPSKTAAASPGSGRIQGLVWSSSKVSILVLPEGLGTRIVAIAKGEFRDEQRVLVVPDAKLEQEKGSRRFSLSIPLKGKVSRFRVQAVDPWGRLEFQDFIIRVDAWEGLLRSIHSGPSRSPFRFGVGLGVSSLAYQQDRTANYSGLALTGKLSATYQLSERWDTALSGYATALELSSSRKDATVRFIGLNFRVGYALLDRSPWRLALHGGGYFATMLVTQKLFGYQGATGPQIYPSLQRQLSPTSMLTAYGKYSPVAQGGSPFTLKSREWAVGLGWVSALGNGRNLSVNADVADLLVVTPKTSARSQSFTVGATYGW